MNYFKDFVGNNQLTARLAQDISHHSLSHAYIIEGPKGSGRHTFAQQVVSAIECRSQKIAPCGECLPCRKILSGNSPDVINISFVGEKSSIGVESIREIKNGICIAPNELSIKAYIIDSADSLTLQAQNALLLSLEEPPSYIVFFLICENSSNLLETIKSRAPILRTERLSSQEVEDFILKTDSRARALKDDDRESFETLLFVADGCIGQALDLLDAKTRKQVFDMRDKAKKLVSMLYSPRPDQVFDIISSLGNKRPEILRQISLLQYALRDLILLKKSDTASLCFFEDRENAAELSTHFTSQGLFSLYDSTLVATDDLERNANIKLALFTMMQRAKLI